MGEGEMTYFFLQVQNDKTLNMTMNSISQTARKNCRRPLKILCQGTAGLRMSVRKNMYNYFKYECNKTKNTFQVLIIFKRRENLFYMYIWWIYDL